MEHLSLTDDDALEYKRHIEYLTTDPSDSELHERSQDLISAPLFSWHAKSAINLAHNLTQESEKTASNGSPEDLFPSYALIGSLRKGLEASTPDSKPNRFTVNPKIEPVYLNTNVPFSVFICGSQGSGKSHSVSCILENCLVPNENIGKLPVPMAGIVFHYDSDAEGGISEAAHLCSAGIDVQVLLCSNSTSREEAWRLLHEHINVENMIALMAFGDGVGMPLYMATVMRTLRELFDHPNASEYFSTDTYRDLQSKLRFSNLAAGQIAMMEQRFEAMNGFLADITMSNVERSRLRDSLSSQPGRITIVDLTHPVIDAATACTLFRICLTRFLKSDSKFPKIVALDEAHKYMNDTPQASRFTDTILTAIRLQRHIAARVIVSTQEPTISPRLLDLCSVTVVHRFTSPAWFAELRSHLAGLAVSKGDGRKVDLDAIFREIVSLKVGESLLFAPLALLQVTAGKPQELAMEYVKMKTRTRISNDGGKSVLAKGENS